MDTALLVFAKVPRPGTVKTRLTPLLRPVEASRLYTAFLRDTLRTARSLEAQVHLYVAPPLPDNGFEGLPNDVTLHAQAGDGLGARMCTAFADTLRAGYDRALLVGTDHPTLPASFLQQAIHALAAPDRVCLGPTPDGGFYLLGMRAFFPQLFAGMSYSHPSVFADTLARIPRTEAQVTVLPQWYDVDTPPDLRRLLDDLQTDSADAPNTRRMVEQLALASRVERGRR